MSVGAPQKIDNRRNQQPPHREVANLILKITKSLVRDIDPARRASLQITQQSPILLSRSSESTPELASGSVSLVVTSQPFLDVVDYRADNWLRGWFSGTQMDQGSIWQFKREDDWSSAMARTVKELRRIIRPGGHLAFEVGEVRAGKVQLEKLVIPAAISAGLIPRAALTNQQSFTKTANTWVVSNHRKGTNTNSVVLFQKSL